MPKHVVVIPADHGGCGQYRLVWPAQAVAHARPDWHVTVLEPDGIQAGFRDGMFTGVRGFPNPQPDLLVMQRVGTPAQFHIFKWASEQGIATVVDFDDAMWCIDKDNLAWRAWNVRNPYNQHWRTCEDAARIADLVTVTTVALAQRYGKNHHRTEVIPNRVPIAATGLPRHEDNEVFTAGWCGYTKTHPGDCTVSAPAAHAVLDDGGALRVVADPLGAATEWGIDPARVDPIGPQKFGPEYYRSISRLDLMLVGLKDTPFNRAKSFLKVLEAGAVGTPSIAPDNHPHRALAATGYPVILASSPSEWADAAKQIKGIWEADGPEYMRELVSDATAANWTIEGNAEHWAQAWERAMQRKHG
jgi:hypothetical protein